MFALLAGASAVLAACGGASDPVPPEAPDATVAVQLDAGPATVDAGPEDAGASLDAGVADSGTVPDAGAPLWTGADVQAFLIRSCSSGNCHNTAWVRVNPSLPNLQASSWYAATVDRPSVQVPRLRLIQPFAPAESYLLLKLSGPQFDDRLMEVSECRVNGRSCGRSMPLGGPNWPTSDDVAGLTSWIEHGAPAP